MRAAKTCLKRRALRALAGRCARIISERREWLLGLASRLDHADLIDTGAGKVDASVRSGGHVAYRTAARRYLGAGELLGLGIEANERVGLHTGLAIPDHAVGGDDDSVG